MELRLNKTSNNPFFPSNERVNQSRVGLSISPTFQNIFHPIFSFHVGLDYQNIRNISEQVPFNQSFTNGITDSGFIDVKDSLNTTIIPIQIRASFGQKTQFFLNTGLNTTIVTSNRSHIVFTHDNPLLESENCSKISGAYDISFGLLTGLGVKVGAGNRLNFSIEARNERTMMRMSDLPYRENFTDRIRITPSILFFLVTN